MRPTLGVLLAGSALLRAALILWGVIQDALLRVPYTDVDYKVFTDAARLVAEGQSPFLRSTYRYSPLLAYVVLPNVWVTPMWGKVGAGRRGWMGQKAGHPHQWLAATPRQRPCSEPRLRPCALPPPPFWAAWHAAAPAVAAAAAE